MLSNILSRLSLIFLFCILFTAKVHGGGYTFNLFDVSHGLPSPYVYNIFQDSRGFLWLGTTIGLSRFDGKQFVNYNTNDGLINNRVTEVFENKKGELVIGTYKGVSIFNGNKFTNFPSPYPSKTTWITGFFQTKDGSLQTRINGSLFELNDKGFKKISQHPVIDTLLYKKITRLRNGDRAIVYSGKLFILNAAGRLQVINSNKKIYDCIATSKTQDDLLVIAEDGVYTVENYRLKILHPYNFSNKIILASLLDSRGRLWVSIEGGGVLLFEHNKLIELNEKDGLSSLFTPCIYEDKQQRIWMGNGRGLYQVRNCYTTFYNHLNGLAEKDIRYMHLGNNGNLYLSQNGKWFAFIENGKLRQAPLTVQNKLAPLMTDARIGGMTLDDRQRFWMGITGGKLLRLSGENIEDLSDRFGQSSFYDQEIFFDRSKKTIWLPLRNGIVLLQDDKVVRSISQKPDGSPLGFVNRICGDDNGNIWLSTRTDMFVFKNNKLHTVQLPHVLPNTYNYFQCVQDSLLWFITENNGVLGCTLTNGRLTLKESITDRNGLPGFQAISAVADKNHGLWIATQAGICRVDLKSKSAAGRYFVHRFSKTDGVPFTNFGISQLIKDDKGDIWNSNLDGLLHFDVNFQYKDTLTPSIVLENITIKDAEGNGKARKGNATFFHLPVNPEMSYSDNSIAFTFSGISLSEQHLSYQYKLSEIQADWQEQAENTPINFYNLSPGKYTFFIKAVSPDGNESKVLKYRFSIAPPFWKTWWFRMLVAISIVGMIFLFIKRREASIKMENQVHLQMSELRMHALQAQMNPHFIFNSLNSIQNYIISNEAMSAAKYLSKFAKLIRRILDNSRHSFIRLEEVLDVLKMYIELEAFRFNNEFSYTFNVQEDEELMDMPFPPMLLQPFVENAIWHGLMPKQGVKNLTIDVHASQGKLVCIIDDNGVGRKHNNIKENHISQGEKITKGLLQSMGEMQHLDASLDIIDKKDNNDSPCGTTVKLTISLSETYRKS
ncbi:sensor histidine kinase [Dyadobacter sp. MSC1_007]|jgi:ligand-binding sensor domain-containing protein|uniref:sensor histidine kinase n=1 Tax=Dyadobacter sp. MSC1_007 TaxID=2909264 RepID=UPI00202EF8F2|nr:two-component regulator propeller domain-containing protein [Dyadobacter sp. MSC1_007]